MATIALPMMLVSPPLTTANVTSQGLSHPQYPMMMIDLWTTQGEIGDGLAARSNTSNTNFSWGH